MLFDQVRIKAVVAGRHWRMSGEDDFPRYTRNRAVECDAFLLHPRVDRLQHCESAVSFIQVKNTGCDAHGFERAETSDAKQQLLPDASPSVSAIKAGGQFSIVRSIAFYIRIEKKQVAASNGHSPDFGMNRTVSGPDLHRDWPAVLADRELQRQLIDVCLQIFFLLPTVTVQALAKISLPIKQSDADERNGEIGRALDVVSRQHSQPTGIDRKRFVYPELCRKICNWTRPQDTGVPCSPSAVRM